MPTCEPPHPPAAREVPYRRSAHGLEWVDNYHWLQERDNPAVVRHLRMENAYTDACMAPFRNLVDLLYTELAGRIEEENVSAPYTDGDYVYQSRIGKGADYRQYYRRKKHQLGAWTLYFDAQAEAMEREFFDLAFLDISPDGRTLAYAVDLQGDELYTLKFRDLETGTELEDVIGEVSGDGEWDAASAAYYYVTEDETRRPFRINRHRLGDPPACARILFEEPDPQYCVGLYKSQDMKYIFACSSSKETTEVRWLEAADPSGSFVTVFPRRTGIQYDIEHHSGSWLVRINEDAPDFKLVRCDARSPNPGGAEILVPAREGIRLEEVIAFGNFLAMLETENGQGRIRIRNLDTGNDHVVPVDDPVCDIHPGVNAEYLTDAFCFVCSSPVRPAQTVRYDMATRTREVIHSVQVPSGHNPDDYSVYRIDIPSSDGVPVPVTVLHGRNFPKNGTRPLYLHGYGAYGLTVEPHFRGAWLSFLERGFAVAVAHVRGGGFLGEKWYQSGKLIHKHNSFRDFISVAEGLVRLGYTRPDRLVIEGGSAGGLLVAAAVNLRPELFRAVVADVPFVDILNTMMDEDLPLTTFEYEDWGNPNEPEAFMNIRSYSPCDNVRELPYPAILATAACNDPRVPYWEAAKWVTLVRRHTTSANPVLLKTYFDSGHNGPSGRYAHLREVAFAQAFLISRVADSLEQD